MPPINPRVIVADARNSLHYLVRAALELMDRRPRLIETYNGDDAMQELKIGVPDLLITAHTLVDTTNGPILALMAKREIAALPIIVIGEETDPEIDAETLAQSPYQYLRRPFSPEAFLRAIRIALDGPEALPKEATAEEIIPVPPIDHDKLKPIMFRLMRDVGAMAAIMADRNGKVVTYEGAAGYIDRDLLAATLGPGFGNTMKLLDALGEQPRVLKYYDGDRSTLFGLSVGLHHFLMLVFANNAPAAVLGNVKRYGTAAVTEMLAVIGDVAYERKPVVTHHKHADSKSRKTRTQEMAPVAPAAAAPAAAVAPAGAVPKAAPKPAAKPIANFDPSLFDTLEKIDLSQADSLFSDEKIAASAASLLTDNRITFDDALTQGILGQTEE
jgi:CheY-like chemotaxis protein